LEIDPRVRFEIPSHFFEEDERRIGTMKENIIVGAGPAGLTAAINLQREGYQVTVWEKEAQIGGPPGWHPSVHGTPVDTKNIWNYIGIDCSTCFHNMNEIDHFIVMGDQISDDPSAHRKQLGFTEGEDYVVERGGRESSLDSFLYRIALDEGVKFEFNRPLKKEDIDSLPPNSILATGLGPDVYKLLDIDFTNYMGYWTYLEVDFKDASGSAYFGAYSNEYGYSCYANGIWYILLFSRKEIPKEGLEEFNKLVKKVEGKEIKEWWRFFGRTPKKLGLFYNDLILTGTLAGFIEPALGFGITGALVSGKIAALTVIDRQKGEAEFDRFTKGIPAFIKGKKEPGYTPKVKMGDVWFEI
jgi:flavin-dependent dehydrogenase